MLAARLRCRRAFGCGGGREARVRIKRLVARLSDSLAPTVRLGGSLFAPGSRRGPRRSLRSARPRRRRSPPALQVNGGPRRREPCPAGSPVRSPSGFVPARARRTPASRRHRLAPLPPGAQHGARLRRRLRAEHRRQPRLRGAPSQGRQPLPALGGFGRRNTERPLRPEGSSAVVAGRLLDRGGRGVPGARVCVATRILLNGAVERVALTPLTGAEEGSGPGSHTAPAARSALLLARRPAALERHLDLTSASAHTRAAAAPPPRNGDRIRFGGAAGPRGAGRRVRIQVRAEALAPPSPGPDGRPGHLSLPLPLPRDHRPPQLRVSGRGAEAERLPLRGRPVQGEARHRNRARTGLSRQPYAGACASLFAWMSASCSPIQTPGSRSRTISRRRCARRARSSGSMVRAR